MAGRLAPYQAKRRFDVSPEPSALSAAAPAQSAGDPHPLQFVVQKHWASRLHYDFRLEWDGVLLSWALPRGLTYDPADKRMAVRVEDHPLAYSVFEGTIPPRQYGAGRVIVWDRGTWTPVGDPQAGLAAGKLIFELHGQKLAGRWELVRIAKPGDKQDPWMLFKKRDAWALASAEYDVLSALPDSVMAKPLAPLVDPSQRGQRAVGSPAGSGPAAAAPGAADPLAALSSARPAPLPDQLAPQLATAASTLPGPHRWMLEPKWDGYRLLSRIGDDGRVTLLTRNGHDWTDKLRAVASAVVSLNLRNCWLDGEIVVLGDHGTPDFNALQNAIDRRARGDDIVYFVFDLPFDSGRDLRPLPCAARRARLKTLLGTAPGARVRFSQDFDAPAAQLMEAARAMRLEGLVAKRADAPYASGRSDTWLKLKNSRRQEFVVVGFTEREGAPGEIGSLLVGVHDDAGAMHYAGNVGTGWDHRAGVALRQQLSALASERPPVEPTHVTPGRWSKRSSGNEHWVRPELVVEVRFAEWTPDGKVRAGVFLGVRADKPAREVRREPDDRAVLAPPAGNLGLKVTNPERVVDARSKLRKIDVVRYYESVAQWLLPHLKDRPVSLVRAPEGVAGELFFQKHPDSKVPGLRALPQSLWPGHGALLAVDTVEALVSAAQMNVLELHTWNSTTRAIDKPDRFVLDLDPGEGVTWKDIQEAALLVHTLLDALGLRCWLKTSGGKGLHVVVPLAPRLPYDTVKSFSKTVVEHLARTIPQKFVAVSGPKNRVGRVFVDYLRNAHAATTATAFSARARPGLGVSMPIAWEQLRELKASDQWTVANAREYLSFQQVDPWADYWACRQSLTQARKMLAGR